MFSFLSCITDEADLNGITETQAIVTSPHFLTGDALLSLQTGKSSGHYDGAAPWPEAALHLLITHAIPKAMCEAEIRIKETRQ